MSESQLHPGWRLPEGCWVTMSVEVEPSDVGMVEGVPLSYEYDWMVVQLQQGSKPPLLWGVVQVTPLLLQYPSGVGCVSLAQCTLGPPPRPSLRVDYTHHVPQPFGRMVSLDEIASLLQHRLRQYHTPTKSCLVSTPQDRALDWLSFRASVSAVARYAGLSPADARYSSLAHWLRGEQRIALHRFRVAHLAEPLFAPAPLDIHPDYVGTYGVDVLEVTDMLPLAHTEQATLHKGKLYAQPLCWIQRVLQHLERTLVPLAKQWKFHTDHPHLVQILESFHSQLRDWDAAPVLPPKKERKPMELNGEPIVPSATLDELAKVMPACVRDLADRAFLPGVTPHLKYEDRCVLYGFVLANGVPATILETRALAKVAEIEGYDTRQIIAQVRQTEQYVHTSKFGLGRGCNTLQNEGFCPWYTKPAGQLKDAQGNDTPVQKQARKHARMACHGNQLTLAGLQRDPRGYAWSIAFPLLFAQELKRILLPASQLKA